MPRDNEIRSFNAADIERYHKGLLSAPERHALEKAALDDPFLAEAIDGYATSGINIKDDLGELEQRLAERVENKKTRVLATAGKYSWFRVAALLILLAGTGALIYKISSNSNKDSIVQSEPLVNKKNETVVQQSPDTVSGTNSFGAATDTHYLAISPTAPGANQSKIETVNELSLNNGLTAPSAKDTIDATLTDKVENNLAIEQVAPVIRDNKTEAVTGSAKRKTENADFNTGQASAPVAAKGVTNKESNQQGILRDDEADSYKQRAANLRTNTFRGRVTDVNNNPLPFANVTNVQDNVGTYTDSRGYFNLTSPDSTLNVQVRSLGYNSNHIELNNAVSNNQVVLQEDKSLNEVVISTKKPNATSRAQGNNMKLEGEPEPEDGWDNYDSYLANNLNIPEDYKLKQSGKEQVKVSFEVNKFGEPVNFKIEKSLCERCDQEAIRLIKAGPKWKRKARNGRTVVTITF